MTEVKSGFLEVENGRLYYEVAGEGHPLVMVHAGVADHTMWDDQVAVFSQNYKTIRYDTRGFGRTTTTPGASFSNRQDIYALLKYLGVEKTFIMGCSRGGQIATDFTLEFPEMVAGLITICAGIGGEVEGIEEPANEMEKYLKAEELEKNGEWEALADLQVEIWVDGFYRNGHANEQAREKVRQMCLSNYRQQSGDGVPRILTPPASGRLHEIKVPALVIIGELDTQVERKISQYLTEGIQGARHVVVSDAAHLPNLEKPEEFNRVVLEFLSEASKS